MRINQIFLDIMEAFFKNIFDSGVVLLKSTTSDHFVCKYVCYGSRLAVSANRSLKQFFQAFPTVTVKEPSRSKGKKMYDIKSI